MERFGRLFKHAYCNVVGMIHLRALPGSPNSTLNIEALSELACQEAELYAKHGIDAIMVENMHDIPYVKSPLGPEIIAAMTRICSDVKKCLPASTPCGVQVLAGGNKEGLAVAISSGFNFIRCEGFVFGHIGDEGYFDSCAGTLLRYRRSIGAEHIQIYCDIKKKHSAHAITSDVSLIETAKAAEFFLADGLIVTGTATGDPAKPSDLQDVASHVDIPVMVGSGVTAENLRNYSKANALIVGSHFKQNGRWDRDIDPDKLCHFMEAVRASRS